MRPAIDYALAYAGAGYRVLPVWVFPDEETGKWAKRPVSKARGLVGGDGRGGVAAATTDPETIRRYWKGRKARCHVGVVPPEGVIVLDDDGGVFPEWLDGPHVRTVSGKAHFYFWLDEGQDGLRSENGIVYREEPEGLVDIRVSGDTRFYVIAPSGTKHYQKVNGLTLAPDRLPVLPAEVYERLLDAPRRGGNGSPGLPGGKYGPGVPAARVGNAYDRRPGVVEELLEEAGWTDEGDRWIRPDGTDGAAKVSEIDGVWFVNVHTFNDPVLHGGHFYTASMLRCVFEFDGRWKPTYMALLNEGAFNSTTDLKEIFK